MQKTKIKEINVQLYREVCIQLYDNFRLQVLAYWIIALWSNMLLSLLFMQMRMDKKIRNILKYSSVKSKLNQHLSDSSETSQFIAELLYWIILYCTDVSNELVTECTFLKFSFQFFIG